MSRSVMRPRAKFGKLSLGVLFAGSCIVLLCALIFWRGEGGGCMVALGYADIAMLILWLACLLSSYFALRSLANRERPSWPAGIGLGLSLPPAVIPIVVITYQLFIGGL